MLDSGWKEDGSFWWWGADSGWFRGASMVLVRCIPIGVYFIIINWLSEFASL